MKGKPTTGRKRESQQISRDTDPAIEGSDIPTGEGSNQAAGRADAAQSIQGQYHSEQLLSDPLVQGGPDPDDPWQDVQDLTIESEPAEAVYDLGPLEAIEEEQDSMVLATAPSMLEPWKLFFLNYCKALSSATAKRGCSLFSRL